MGQYEVNEQSVSNGDFSFDAKHDGKYVYCFGNEHWGASSKEVSFNVHGIVYVSEADAPQEPLEVEVRKLSELLELVKDEQSYIVVRERTHRNTAESTNSRVKWWNIFVIGVVVGESVFQVWWLRRFFEVRSIRLEEEEEEAEEEEAAAMERSKRLTFIPESRSSVLFRAATANHVLFICIPSATSIHQSWARKGQNGAERGFKVEKWTRGWFLFGVSGGACATSRVLSVLSISAWRWARAEAQPADGGYDNTIIYDIQEFRPRNLRLLFHSIN